MKKVSVCIVEPRGFADLPILVDVGYLTISSNSKIYMPKIAKYRRKFIECQKSHHNIYFMFYIADSNYYVKIDNVWKQYFDGGFIGYNLSIYQSLDQEYVKKCEECLKLLQEYKLRPPIKIKIDKLSNPEEIRQYLRKWWFAYGKLPEKYEKIYLEIEKNEHRIKDYWEFMED